MSLVFNFDWLSIDESVAAEELRATSSILEIWVDGECVTMSYDTVNRSVRRSVAVAMYPVAEWIAFNWWLLTHNSRVAKAHYPTELRSRHSLTSAGDGYAWPDLTIVPQGELAELRWRRTQPVATDIVYATEGHRVVPLSEVQAALTDVVETVLSRLEESGIANTPLQEEWTRLASLDREEAEFCEASARLGLDPFSEGIEYAEALESVYQHLDNALRNDFLDAAEPSGLEDELAWVRRGLARAAVPRPTNGAAFDVNTLAESLQPPTSYEPRPWETGYQLARAVRSALNLAPDAPLPDDIPVHVDEDNNGYHALSGVGMHPGDGSVINLVLTRRLRDVNRRFAVSRALWHSLTEAARPFLLTSASSSRQRAGRAFAAELLAPAEGIRSMISGYHALDPDDVVSDIADHFRASELVVLHQIENQLN